MKGFIDGIDFHNLAPQKYWSMPASWAPERKQQEVKNAIFSGEYVGARKIDGAFYKFVKDEDGNMELLGRSKSVNGDYLNKIEWVPQLQSFFNALPNGTCLLGEIYFPHNEGSNHVTTIMGCLKDKAIARQEAGEKLHYYVFDCLAYNNKSYLKIPVEGRLNDLNDLAFIGQVDSCIEFARYYSSGEEIWEKLQSILAEGGEGMVITKKGTCYQPDKRPARQTFKIKKELQETLDVVVLDANPPTRLYNGKEIVTWKYWENTRTGEKINAELYKDYMNGATVEPVTKNYFFDWAGSLVIGVYNPDTKKYRSIGSLSGLTEEVLSNWKDYVGKVAEITGMQIFKDDNGDFSGIRHPKLITFRSDKDKKECTMEQFL